MPDVTRRAEHARTAVAAAQTVVVTAYPRCVAPVAASVPALVVGSALHFCLPTGGTVAPVLAVRRFVTVLAAPAGWRPTTLLGTVRAARDQQTRAPEPGSTRFVADILQVRVSGSGRVDVDDFWAAEPDPLRDHAPTVIAHLRRHHGQELTRCLRARGYAGAQWVEATGLDRYGLDLRVLDADGVADVRLDFPAPVRSLAELGPGMRLALGAG